MTMTLTEFLLARIAEDEELARTAMGDGDGRWASWSRSWDDGQRRDLAVDGVRIATLETSIDEHVCRHEPARVLAECEAKRKIVAFHESWPTLVQTPAKFERDDVNLDNYTYRMSQEIAWLTTREYVARFGIDPPTAPMLAALALPYADHEDYNEEWRP